MFYVAHFSRALVFSYIALMKKKNPKRETIRKKIQSVCANEWNKKTTPEQNILNEDAFLRTSFFLMEIFGGFFTHSNLTLTLLRFYVFIVDGVFFCLVVADDVFG